MLYLVVKEDYFLLTLFVCGIVNVTLTCGGHWGIFTTISGITPAIKCPINGTANIVFLKLSERGPNWNKKEDTWYSSVNINYLILRRCITGTDIRNFLPRYSDIMIGGTLDI